MPKYYFRNKETKEEFSETMGISAPLEIGCRVSYGNSRVWNGRVVAIDGNFAWVKWDEGDTNSGGVYSLSSLNKFCRRIDKKDVKKHIPTPRPLTVGEQVEFKPPKYYVTWATNGTIKAIVGESAWVSWNNKHDVINKLEDLKRIE